jgi:hypothetical protein
MMITKITTVLAATLVLFTTSTMAQRTCGTMDAHNAALINDPLLQLNADAIEQFTQQYVASLPAGKKKRTLVTIPVVFHVVYENATENISNALLLAQLEQLNLDYAKLNSDTGSVPSPFKVFHTNTDIQFCLAVRDPQGNATTGITRTATTTTSFSTNNDVKYTANGGKDGWPRDSYLNFWVCDLGSSLLGYGQFPGGAAATDGVVCNYNTVGSMALPGTNSGYDLGRTATHEVGHWLNLRHIWGDDNSCTGSDQVNDTPNSEVASYGCPTYPLLDACATASPGGMFMNYMDYVDDACMHMFTAGQGQRMQALFATGGDRFLLTQSQGCIPVLPCSGTPAGGTASASIDTINCEDSLKLSVSGSSFGQIGVTLQWQVSQNNTTWTNIAGATNNNTNVPATLAMNGSNYFRVAVNCSTSSITSYSASVLVYRNGITDVTGDTICVAGAVSLTALNGVGTIKWYSDAAGTNLVYTGNPYNTTVTGNTTLYAQISNTASYTVGAPNTSIGTAGTNNNFANGLIFNTQTSVVIDTVFVYPGSAGNIKVNLYDSATGVKLDSTTITVTAAQINVKTPVAVGFACTAGGWYKITPTGSTVTSLYRNTTGFTYPYTIPNVISITGPVLTTTIRYAFFYDWKLSAGCDFPLYPVNILVNTVNLTTTVSNILCAGTLGSIVANAPGAGMQYKLNSGVYTSNGNFSNLSSGVYTITAKNAQNCTTSATVTMNSVIAISLSLTSTPANLGNNGSISASTLGGVLPYTYSLNGGVFGVANSFNNLTAGVYTVCIKDANGCSTCSSVTITNPSLVFVSANNTQASCSGASSGIIVASATSGSSPYTYALNGGSYSSNNTFTGLTAGIYTVNAKDANNATSTVTVIVAASSFAISSVASTATGTSPCIGTLTCNITNGVAPITYTVNGTVNVGNMANGLCAATYTFCATDATGCTACQTAIVPLAAPLAFGLPTLSQPCSGGTNGSITAPTTGGVAPITYSIGSGFGATNTFSNLSPAVYTITAQDGSNATTSTVINLNASANLVFNVAQTATIACNAACTAALSATLTQGVATYSYSINGGASQASGAFTNLCAGSYTLVGTDQNGCSASTVYTIAQPNPVSENTQVTNIKCTGDSDGSISITGTAGTSPFLYSINGGALSSNTTYSGLAAGVYTILVQDANSCTHTTTLSVVQAPNLLAIGATATPSSGNTGTVTVNVSGGVAPYLYSLNNSGGQASNVFGTLPVGTYTVSVTDGAGCVKTMVISVLVPEAVNQFVLSGSLALYPNPTADFITIELVNTKASMIQLAITNALGQVVIKDFALCQGGSVAKKIDVSTLASGTYNVLITDDKKQSAVKQFVVK